MSYITLAYLQQYADERAIELFEYDDIQLGAALVIAADFIDAYYNFAKPLDDYAPEPLPTNIQKANAEAAIMHLRGLLLVDSAAVSAGTIESTSKSLDGVGSASVTYAKGSQQTYKRSTPIIDRWLQPFMSAQSSRLQRVL